MTPTRYQLDNGLTVVFQPNHTSQVVAFQAWVGVGSADEPPELAGMAHVFEHMLFKGTARRKVGEIAQEVEGCGGDINAWTSFDQTVYHLVLASRFFDNGLDILSDALQNSAFDPTELERELKVVLEEVKQGEDNPGRVASQSLFSTAFSRHPYRRPVIGYTRTVKSFTRDRLLDFFHRYYVANNVTLVVVGDFDEKMAQQKIAAAFSKMPRRELERPVRKEPTQRAPRVKVVTQTIKETHLQIGFHVPAIGHEDVAALDLISIILGQGDSSRLSTIIKRQSGLASDVFSYAYTPKEPGLFVAGASFLPARWKKTIEALSSELFRFCFEEVTQEEIDKAKTIVESDAVYQKETVQGMARKLGFFESSAGGLGYEEQYRNEVRALTPRRLREVAERYLTVENATVTVLGPKEGEVPSDRALIEGLERGQALAESRFRPASEVPDARTASEVVRVKLPNGARLVVMRDPSVQVVAMRAVWAGGLRNEDEKVSGVNNLLAALITRGTESRTGDELAREIESLAGAVGGFTGRNSFGVRAEILSQHWERGLEILADCILYPKLDEAEVERERRLTLEEIHTQEDNISSAAFRLFFESLYHRHPYRLDLLGTAKSVAALSRRRLLDYYRRNMPEGEMTLAIVGDVDPAAVVKRAKALFFDRGERKEASVRPPIVESPTTEPTQVFRFMKKQQAHVVYGFPGTTVTHKDRFALELLATVLSGQGGRLFVELRDKRGLAYRVSAFSIEGVDPGYFAVYIATSPENLTVAVEGIEDELRKMIEKPVPREELDRAQRYLVGTHDISLQRRAALAASLAFHECYGLGWDAYRHYADGIMGVTAEELQRVARKYLDRRRAVIATVKPEEVTPRLAQRRAASKAASGPQRGGSRLR